MLLGEMCKASKATQLPFPLNVNKTDPVENFFTMEREKPKKKKKRKRKDAELCNDSLPLRRRVGISREERGKGQVSQAVDGEERVGKREVAEI